MLETGVGVGITCTLYPSMNSGNTDFRFILVHDHMMFKYLAIWRKTIQTCTFSSFVQKLSGILNKIPILYSVIDLASQASRRRAFCGCLTDIRRTFGGRFANISQKILVSAMTFYYNSINRKNI
jgi:hypothetical protein